MEEIVGAAVERCSGDDLVAGRGEGEDGERFRRLARGRGEGRRAAFQSGYPLLKDVGRGIHDAGVDVSKLLQRDPDAPKIYLSDSDLQQDWTGPDRVFLLVPPQLKAKVDSLLPSKYVVAEVSGKYVYSNRP